MPPCLRRLRIRKVQECPWLLWILLENATVKVLAKLWLAFNIVELFLIMIWFVVCTVRVRILWN